MLWIGLESEVTAYLALWLVKLGVNPESLVFRNIRNRDNIVQRTDFAWQEIQLKWMEDCTRIGGSRDRVLVEFAPRTPKPKLTGESAFEFIEEPNLNVIELNILSEVLVQIVLCGVPDVASECNQTCATASSVGLPDRTLEGVY